MSSQLLLVPEGPGKWTAVGTLADRRLALSVAVQLYEAKISREGYRRRNGFLFSGVTMLWKSGLFNLSHISAISGVSRKTVRTWLGIEGTHTRPRGYLNMDHLSVLHHTVTQFRPGDDTLSDDYLSRLQVQGTSPNMATFLLGTDKKGKLEVPYGGNDLLTEIRSDDPGHPSSSEGGSGSEHPHPSDDGHESGEEVSQPADAGLVQGAELGDSASEPRTAAEQGQRTEHSRVEPEERVAHQAATTAEDDWNPYEGFNPDLDGDSLLLGGGDSDRSGLLPQAPAPGDFWEQAEED